ncbi:WSC domain-containing protein [Podospora appendiculata]|uniref:WSC domain-containing protein n=1 Tax=Podospora appendiculata TaxID=314037 RepID=A0AAE1C757_9PEZI|nr:WSC domain-containing protein [Podospora appendiculata]
MHFNLLALAALAPAVLGQTYYGCYTEGETSRALTGASYADFSNMTVELCASLCSPYPIWGLEYTGECYCGDALTQGSFPAFASDCAMVCAGDAGEVCGGPNRLSLYGTSATPPTITPVPHAAVTAASFLGCYVELTGGRVLSGRSAFSATGMTNDACGSYCLNSGFLFYGTEYSAECYCGTGVGSANSTDVSECLMDCSGDATQKCGGPSRLSIYEWA